MRSREEHIRVPRTARYRVLGDPATAAEVWVVLHGYRQLAERFVGRFVGLPGVAEGRRAVVAPEALSRFYIEEEVGPHGPESRVGASWMTRADREHEIRDYVEYLDRVAEVVLRGEPRDRAGEARPTPEAPVRPATPGSTAGSRRRSLVVLGFSQGAETASRWVTYGRVRPTWLVLWGGGTAVDLAGARVVEALGRVRVRLVVGSEDRWGRSRAEATGRTLEELDVAFERLEYEGGHRIEPSVLTLHWPLSALPA